MATKPTTTTTAKRGTAKVKPLTLDQGYEALANAKAQANAVERDSSSILAAKWGKFDHVVEANKAFGAILRGTFAALMGNPSITGSALRTAMDTPGSAVFRDDAKANKALGSDAHFTRCLQLVDRDTAEARAAFRSDGNAPNLRRYLAWFDAKAGKYATDQVVDGGTWQVERDASGAITSAVFKAKPRETADDEAKVTHPVLALGRESRETLDAIVVDGAAYLEAIPADKWEDVARVLVARLVITTMDAAPAAPANAAGFSIPANA